MAVMEVLEVLAVQAVSILITETLVTKWKDLGNQRETLGDQRETLGDKKNDLDGQRKDLNESKAAMPQIVKQTGWAKPNQLPAGPKS